MVTETDIAVVEAVLGSDLYRQCLRLREAVEWCGGPFIDCGRWFDVADTVENYGTGEVTSYSLHPPKGITAASYRRLARLLGTEKVSFESHVRQFREDNADGHY